MPMGSNPVEIGIFKFVNFGKSQGFAPKILNGSASDSMARYDYTESILITFESWK